ncbi:hypothetical protein ACVWZD_000787 [Streptomyces sp. TE3672]|nr:hypothetical protein [Streptomyces sp. NBC_00051]
MVGVASVPCLTRRAAGCFRILQNHVRVGGTLSTAAGDVVVQGEDPGRWVSVRRFGWEQLVPAQQWFRENILGIEAPGRRSGR